MSSCYLLFTYLGKKVPNFYTHKKYLLFVFLHVIIFYNMGLLTDPRAENGKIIKFILQWEKMICYLLFIVGITWMMLLALPNFNDNTYYSENALLPGLVKKESNLMPSAKKFHQQLGSEREKFRDSTPYAWIIEKFRQLHLDVFTHNFTVNYPFKKEKYTGQNIYGIVRAPRSASTESIVVCVPYRPISSIQLDTSPSLALLLAFAQFCRGQKYWEKDLIFLVTEHEQLGLQAWLDAYHGVTSGRDGILMSGDLSGRAGSIQAAINLEIHSNSVSSIDVKIEGLNGQLPNLDLFNLAQNMINKEGIRRSFQRRFDKHEIDELKNWWYHFNTLMSMTLSQAAGVPTGNHGLFHRFGIEAVTLEGFNNGREQRNFYHVGRVVESIVRSLNNLLERFHQSYFFYLLPCTDRYISIGLYMPALVLMIAGIFVKAFCIWLRLQDTDSNLEMKDLHDYSICVKVNDFYIGSVISEILWTHIIGLLLLTFPKLFTTTLVQHLKLKTDDLIFYSFLLMTSATIIVPNLNFKWKRKLSNVALVNVITCVEFGTVLMCIAMHNFALALILTALYAPMVLSIDSIKKSRNRFQKVLYSIWPLLHPFFITCLTISVYTCVNHADEDIISIFFKSFNAIKHAFVLSIIDSMIYGNWFYNIVVSIMFPIWMLYWKIVINNEKINN